MMISKPWFSRPRRLDAGTATLSNSMKVDPVTFTPLAYRLRYFRTAAACRKPAEKEHTACRHTRILHSPTAYSRSFEWDDECRNALFTRAPSSHSSCAVISKYAVGDPFLGSVDNVLIAVALCRGGNAGYIGSSCSAVRSVLQFFARSAFV